MRWNKLELIINEQYTVHFQFKSRDTVGYMVKRDEEIVYESGIYLHNNLPRKDIERILWNTADTITSFTRSNPAPIKQVLSTLVFDWGVML